MKLNRLNHPNYYLWYVLALVVTLDQWSKHWVLFKADLPHRPPMIINDYLSFVMVWNKGVSFGMFNGGAAYMPWVLMGMAIVISGILLRLALRSTRTFERLAYALVIGGALSNAIDRARFGAVVDFIYAHVGELGWPAFNVADSCICIGVIFLLLLQFEKSPRT